MSQKRAEGSKKKKTKFTVIFAIVAFVILLVWWGNIWAVAWLYGPKPGTIKDSGEFGDMNGALNALFSGLAFAGVIVTLLMQSEQLNMQHDELIRSTKAHEDSSIALQQTTELQALQILIQSTQKEKDANQLTEGELESLYKEITNTVDDRQIKLDSSHEADLRMVSSALGYYNNQLTLSKLRGHAKKANSVGLDPSVRDEDFQRRIVKICSSYPEFDDLRSTTSYQWLEKFLEYEDLEDFYTKRMQEVYQQVVKKRKSTSEPQSPSS